jgi:hypothetical protein
MASITDILQAYQRDYEALFGGKTPAEIDGMSIDTINDFGARQEAIMRMSGISGRPLANEAQSTAMTSKIGVVAIYEYMYVKNRGVLRY